ncbi:MAG: ribonucleoside-triphosphate reductase, partial [Marivivens sp.]|nr:ribonucleoside-triphosphate reductase [Marivivens sp.]
MSYKSNLLPTQYQNFIALSRYARWLPEEGRRENWSETVDRYVDNVVVPCIDDSAVVNELREAILGLSVMPSMRMLMTAGPALNRDNTAGYNCSYIAVDDVKAFDEAMMILLCGTGVGFSVERQHIAKLPEVPDQLFDSEDVIVVHDSKEGWAKAYRKLIAMLYAGEVPKWDVSKVRPAGAKLKTFGGRASGPEPLVDLFNFTINVFKNAAGRRLNSIECHDIMCKIGDIVVVGGVRRSAMISLSNLSDDRMRHAKSGQWWEQNPQRALANNSVVYTEKPDIESFMREWTALVESKSGERGIFARYAAEKHVENHGRRKTGFEWGTNPCSEIILRSNQFCNLTEVVVRATDSKETLRKKVRLATILGTVQSTYTKFPYLRKVWTKNT